MMNGFRRYRSLLLKTFVTVSLLVWLFFQIDVYRTLGQWKEADWLYIVLVGPPVSFACLAINVLRWHSILTYQGTCFRLWTAAVIYTKALFFAAFVPGGAATADLYRIRSLARTTRDLDGSIKSVVLDRTASLVGLLMMTLTALLCVPFQAAHHSMGSLAKPATVAVLSCFAIAVGCLWLRGQRFRENCGYPWLKELYSFIEVIPQLLMNRGLMFKQVVLSIALQLVIVGWTYVVSRALQISVPFMALFIAVPLVSMSLLLPISLGGVGVREAGYVFFLVPFGLTLGEATSLGLVSGLVQDALRLGYGLIFVWDPSKENGNDGRDGQERPVEKEFDAA
jgi:uncharacterized membrane protein YbhN (UPF0104 family)